jgi:hypothetical protein
MSETVGEFMKGGELVSLVSFIWSNRRFFGRSLYVEILGSRS